MKKIPITVLITAVLVSGFHFWMLKDSPGGFWIYPLNRSDCKLSSIELLSESYTIRFDGEQIMAAELASGAPQLFVPMLKEAEFRLITNFEKCPSLKTGTERIRKGSGYYIQINKSNVAFDKRV